MLNQCTECTALFLGKNTVLHISKFVLHFCKDVKGTTHPLHLIGKCDAALFANEGER
jgi:hypothetical protein